MSTQFIGDGHAYRTADRVARATARALLRRMRGGELIVEEGRRRERFGTPGDVTGTLRVLHPSLWRRAVGGGGVGFAEAYMDRLWESDDIVSVLRVLARNLDSLNRIIRTPLTRVR